MNSCCAVFGCTNNAANTDPSIQYYYFPKHPVIAQQWISACWRLDPIDVNTAHVCSIHFDGNCYTSEYKMNYLGNYAKVLKPTAVPNLYLPNPQPSIIIKTDCFSNEDNFISESNAKEILVYQLQSLPVASVCTEDLVEENEKYKNIVNKKQLADVIKENSCLKRNCEQLKISVSQIRQKVKSVQGTVRSLDEEIKTISDCIDSLQTASMSVTEQKHLLSKVFSESQIKILSGKKKIYWSNDDMAMGYTLRHLSNKRCYMYLSKNLNIPLPALSSIKRWLTLKKVTSRMNTKKTNKVKEEDSE